MSLVIVHTEVGNIGSVANMCRWIGTDPVVSRDPEVIEQATKLLLPGVGAFDPAMDYLNRTGLRDALDRQFAAQVPILAICLGMQLLLESSEEGELPGLGWIPGEVRLLRSDGDCELRVPHMGWSPIALTSAHPLFEAVDLDSRYYFVHSYVACPAEDRYIVATAEYGQRFAAAVALGNVTGVQFHPEKSHRYGKAVMRRFIEAKE